MARRENKEGGEKWLETRDLIRLVGKIHSNSQRRDALADDRTLATVQTYRSLVRLHGIVIRLRIASCKIEPHDDALGDTKGRVLVSSRA